MRRTKASDATESLLKLACPRAHTRLSFLASCLTRTSLAVSGRTVSPASACGARGIVSIAEERRGRKSESAEIVAAGETHYFCAPILALPCLALSCPPPLLLSAPAAEMKKKVEHFVGQGREREPLFPLSPCANKWTLLLDDGLDADSTFVKGDD